MFIAGALALGALVMALWNAVLPAALHAGRLSYWQGVGLLVLCRVLFGSWSGGRRGMGGPGLHRPGPQERWLSMSEEERRAFRQRWQARGPRWGWNPPAPGTTPDAASNPDF
ncbi:MAG: hypothetical protein EOO56_21385 [Hymenobacter sp.]|nr:MAG: hypothetical protein EOO56_21385 [Hymenobacter sp.]